MTIYSHLTMMKDTMITISIVTITDKVEEVATVAVTVFAAVF